MAKARKSLSSQAVDRTLGDGATYRGVHLVRTEGRTQFTAEQVRHAVAAAVTKNANALVNRGKA